jgi:Tfp pilus assembly protein FimT
MTNGSLIEKRLRKKIHELKAALSVARTHAVSMDCGRMCDRMPSLSYREQWQDSERVVDTLIAQVMPNKSRKP